jgi:Domain of unknown function (DUF3854)
MTVYPNHAPETLKDSHRRTLEVGSAIFSAVYEESGVQSITHGHQLPRGFSKRQRERGMGMLFMGHRPNGKTFYVFRPDDPDPDDPGRKYEVMPKRRPGRKHGGPGNVLYVHPSQRRLVADTSVPVIYVEGIKKALSIISAAGRADAKVLVVAISGVWNFLSDGKPIADMLDIPVEGREVAFVFDSPDILRNSSVQGAAVRLAETEIGRGATVRVAFLPDPPDGEKMGADDFLASGKTYGELCMTMRAYDHDDFEVVKLAQDDDLRAAFEDLERRHSNTVWSWRGAETDSNLYQAVAALARKHGKIHADGIWVQASWGTLAVEAKIGSSRTVGKGLARLEAQGLLYRDTAGRKEGKPGAFVLRASVKQVGGARDGAKSLRGRDPSTLHPRSPRLWASRPKFKPTKKMIREHRQGVRSHLPEPREGVKRLAKWRSHAFDRLDASGGTLTLEELAELLGVRRPGDLTRRKRTEKGRDGLLVWPIEAGIVVVKEDEVSLTPDWLERLEEQRELCEEIDADEQANRDRKRRSLAYRDYLERKRRKAAGSKPSAAGLEAIRRSHELREAGLAAIAERAAAAAKPEEVRKAEAFVRDRLRELGRIRLALLQDIWHDAGGDPFSIPRAVEALGCRVEEMAEFDDRRFVFAPMEGVA